MLADGSHIAHFKSTASCARPMLCQVLRYFSLKRLHVYAPPPSAASPLADCVFQRGRAILPIRYPASYHAHSGRHRRYFTPPLLLRVYHDDWFHSASFSRVDDCFSRRFYRCRRFSGGTDYTRLDSLSLLKMRDGQPHGNAHHHSRQCLLGFRC